MKNNSSILAIFAREDINIFNIHKEGNEYVVEYEYGWSPTEYKTKWTKAVYISSSDDLYTTLCAVLEEVRMIREELNN